MSSERQTSHQQDLLRNVQAYMKARRLSTRAVARLIGCSPSNLSRIFNGKIGLNATTERRLISSLSVEDTNVESFLEIISDLPEQVQKLLVCPERAALLFELLKLETAGGAIASKCVNLSKFLFIVQAQQPLGIPVHNGIIVPESRMGVLFHDLFQWPEDQGEGRPEFMGYIRKELQLHLPDLFSFFGFQLF